MAVPAKYRRIGDFHKYYNIAENNLQSAEF